MNEDIKKIVTWAAEQQCADYGICCPMCDKVNSLAYLEDNWNCSKCGEYVGFTGARYLNCGECATCAARNVLRDERQQNNRLARDVVLNNRRNVMDKSIIEQLGITKEDIEKKVVEAVVDDLHLNYDHLISDAVEQVKAFAKKSLEEGIEKQCTEAIGNDTEAFLASIKFAEHTRWGDRIGSEKSLKEYAVDYATKWLTDRVDAYGKPSNSGSASPRLVRIINSHLKSSLEQKIDKIMSNAHEHFGQSLKEVLENRINEIVSRMKV